MNNRENIRKDSAGFRTWILILPFMGILLFPLIDQWMAITPEITWVRKSKAPAPEFDINSLDKYPGATDKWLEDYSRTRSFLLKKYIEIKRNVLNAQPFPNRVMEGKEGWFYYGMDSQNYFQGELRYSEDEMKYLEKELKRRNDWCNEKGIGYYLVVAPSKHTVYSEYLPRELEKVHQPIRSNQLKKLAEQNPDIHVIDLKKILLENKKELPLFYKTDHHWNQLGGYWGYVEIMNVLLKDYPELTPPLPLDQFQTEKYETEGGRLAQILGLEKEYKETVLKVTNDKEKVVRENKFFEDVKRGEYEGVFTCEGKKKKVLIIQDSFADATMDFFPKHFGKTIYFHDRYKYLLNEDIIEIEKPDIVITFVYESNLGRLLPDKKDALR